MTDRTPTPPDIVFLLSKEGDNIRFDAARRDPASQGAWLIDRLGALNVAQVQNAQRTIQAEYAAAVGEQLEGDAVVRWLVDWGRRTWGLLPLEFRERFYPNFMAGGRATTLQILADGPTIWWEIALAEGGEASPGAPLDAMLGRRFGIGRWHRLPGDLLREADIDRLLATIPPSFQV